MTFRILKHSLAACACLLTLATSASAQTISGEVIEDATAQPLRAYQVRLFYLGQGDSTRLGQGDSTRAIDSTTTDERGLFQFGGQGPGRYRLEFGPVGSRLVSSARVEAGAGDMMTAVRFRVPVLELGGAQAFAEKDVQQVAHVRTVVPLRYPEDLRNMNMSGEVLMRFVVEPTGSVRPGSVNVVRSTHPSFTRTVMEALRTMKFDPARVGGIAVPQLVEEPFTFSMDRGR
jgi:TonB family protein